ncbi:MAG: cytochrome b/b6 domain-containing protein [Kiloniellaceae bacterium]
MSTASTTYDKARMIRVWDPFVRVFHWAVVAGFFIAYFTEDDLLSLHVWAGYTVGGLVVLRILWGFVGPRYARFSDFVCRPSKAWSYARDLIAFRARRHVGHSPAGGLMALVLMAGLLATVWSGLDLYATENNAGPLAAISAATSMEARAATGAEARAVQVSEENGRDDEGKGILGELHEGLATFMFILVLLHVGGVLLASVAHRENLTRAMVTGLKRPPD